MKLCAEKLDMVPQHGREQCCHPAPSTHTDGCSVLHPRACTSTACDISRLPGACRSFHLRLVWKVRPTSRLTYLKPYMKRNIRQKLSLGQASVGCSHRPSSLSPQFFFFVFSRLPTMLSRPEHNPALGTQCLDIGYTQVERPVH